MTAGILTLFCAVASLASETPPEDLVKAAHYLLDDKQTLTLPEVQDASRATAPSWTPTSTSPLRINPPTTVWFRLLIDSPRAQTAFIEHPWNMVTGESVLYHAGEALRPIRSHASLFVVNLQAGVSTLYVAIHDVDSRMFKPNLRATTAEVYQALQRDIAYSRTMFYGAALSMALLTLSMLVVYRRLYFLYYVIYNLSMLALLAIGSFHLPNASTLTWPGLLITNAIATCLFMESFLKMWTRMRRLTWCMLGLLTTYIALTLIDQALNRETYAFAPQVGVYVIAAIAAGTGAFRRIAGAKFLFAGWAIFAIGFAVNTITLRFGLNAPSLVSTYSAFALETILFTTALIIETKRSESLAQGQNEHALAQLAKVFYPHQIEQIRSGKTLEETMPTGDGDACVLVFDVVSSSTIRHDDAKAFLQGIFRRCNEVMNRSYDGASLTANAYRVKELGDGFICSVGFPFASPGHSKSEAALSLALEFHAVFIEEVAAFSYHEKINCCIGIALDHVAGFFPETGNKSYDLFGRGIILATRYEAMRKSLASRPGSLHDAKRDSLLIIQEKVYASLCAAARRHFTAVDLRRESLVVRDDPEARHLYVRILDVQKGKGLPDISENLSLAS